MKFTYRALLAAGTGDGTDLTELVDNKQTKQQNKPNTTK